MLKRHGRLAGLVLSLILATVLACGGTPPPTPAPPTPLPTATPAPSPEPAGEGPCETDEGMAYLRELDAQVDLVLPAAEVLSELLGHAASDPGKSDSILWKTSVSAASRTLVIALDGVLAQRAPAGLKDVEAKAREAATATRRAVSAYEEDGDTITKLAATTEALVALLATVDTVIEVVCGPS